MKDLFAVALIVSLLAACSKNGPEDPIDPVTPPVDTTTHIIELGKVSVLKNAVPWNADFSAHYYPMDKSRFWISGHLLQNGFDHYFHLKDVSIKSGLQQFEPLNFQNPNNGIPESIYHITLDLDQYLKGYDVDTTRAHQFVEVIRYDSVQQIVEGRFQTFLEGSGWSWLFPDSLAFTEGKFHLKIQ